MSFSSTQRTYPDRRRKEYIKQYELHELFDPEEIALKLKVARHRIAATFFYATERYRGRERACTGNYIVNVDKRQKYLVDYIIEKTLVGRGHGIVTATELPEWVGDRPAVLKAIINDVNRRLIAVELSRMVQESLIWFNEYHSTWETMQSVMDQFQAELNHAREIRKVDERLRREDLHDGGRLEVVH